MTHSGTQPFETERLICRLFCEDDLEDMYIWASDPRIQIEYGEPVYDTLEKAHGLLASYISGYERDDFYRWAIIERQSGRNIGMIAFCRVYDDIAAAEIEYCISEDHSGRGYAGEALRGLIGHTFANTGFEKLEAYHRAENVRSGRVLEKSGMHKASNVERFAREGTSPEGEVCYCIKRNERI